MPVRSRRSSRCGAAPSPWPLNPRTPTSASFVVKTPGFVSGSNTPKPSSESKKKLQPCWGYRWRRPSTTRRHDADRHRLARQQRPHGKRLCRSRTLTRQRLSRPHTPPSATACTVARLAPPRALGPEERSRVLDVLRTPRFVDLAPTEIYATLLDEGVYLCSIRTLYRILAEEGEVRERRDQLRHPVYQKPELLAEAPNQVWSWDITKLMGPAKWSYFYLYVILDIFSRRVV